MLILLYVAHLSIAILTFIILIMGIKISRLKNYIRDINTDMSENRREIDEKFNKVYRMISNKADKQ